MPICIYAYRQCLGRLNGKKYIRMLNCSFSERKNPSTICDSELKIQINKMLAHCFNPQLARGACAVVRLASAAVNQNQARFKYRFCTVSEFQIFV